MVRNLISVFPALVCEDGPTHTQKERERERKPKKWETFSDNGKTEKERESRYEGQSLFGAGLDQQKTKNRVRRKFSTSVWTGGGQRTWTTGRALMMSVLIEQL